MTRQKSNLTKKKLFHLKNSRSGSFDDNNDDDEEEEESDRDSKKKEKDDEESPDEAGDEEAEEEEEENDDNSDETNEQAGKLCRTSLSSNLRSVRKTLCVASVLLMLTKNVSSSPQKRKKSLISVQCFAIFSRWQQKWNK